MVRGVGGERGEGLRVGRGTCGGYLVRHQRDQRRDHHNHAPAHERRQLVADRLAAACRVVNVVGAMVVVEVVVVVVAAVVIG